MDLGLYIAASGMVAEQTRQDQLTNDLANASTPGYKSDQSTQHSFGELLLTNTSSGQTVGSLNTGVALGKAVTDMTPAGMQTTGQALDFGIAGTGFFAVKTSQGTRYTRDGQFTTAADGKLVDSSGNQVLSQSGAPITVGAEGRVSAGALGVFNVPNAVKQGDNNFSGSASGSATGLVRQGVLEQPGVDAAKVMVDTIAAMRSFQSSQQAIQTIDETLRQASTQVGSLNGGA